MNTLTTASVATAIACALLGTGAFAQDTVAVARIHQSLPGPPQPLTRPDVPKRPQHPAPAVPKTELPSTSLSPNNAGFATTSAFSATVAPNASSGSTLTAPIGITYSGGSPTVLVNDNGTNKGIESLINNSANSTSALYGLTNGSGAGLTGYNTGTSGPAGKFGILNSDSAQPGVFATTNGVGPAMLGTITNKNTNYPAILGQNITTAGSGIGIEGNGNNVGVYGSSTTTGVYGINTTDTGGIGVYGNSYAGHGVDGESASNTGVYGHSDTGDGVDGISSGNGHGVYGYSANGNGIEGVNGGSVVTNTTDPATVNGVYGYSPSGAGVYGESSGGSGVSGFSETGNAVFGYSVSGLAGYFLGNAYVAGLLKADAILNLSDRNAKTHIRPVDSKDILIRVARLPVATWDFKTSLTQHHLGPMAQDFHAAFGLGGDDDTHINLGDLAGVSLAAIQELSKQLSDKDHRIAVLEAENAEFKREFAEMRAALSDLKTSDERLARR